MRTTRLALCAFPALLPVRAIAYAACGAALLATASVAQGPPVQRGSIGNFRPSNIAVGNGAGGPVAFMAGSDGSTGVEPYRFTGAGAPALIQNLRTGGAGSFPDQFVPLSNEKVFFTARAATNNRVLYFYDTSVPPPVPPPVPMANPPVPSFPAELTVLDATTILFSANDGSNGRELWKSNGTPLGTVMVKDIDPGMGASSSPHNFIALGLDVLFAATEPTGGTELWKSNGTTAGTTRLVDIVPGSASSYPGEMARLGSQVFFAASTPGAGRELWVTDGTAVGTHIVADLNGLGDSAPDQLTPDPVNGVLAFTAVDTVFGRSLFVRNGSVIVRSTISNAVSISHLTPLQIAGGAFVFAIDTPTSGRELGGFESAQGMHAVLDVRSGPMGSSPTNFIGRSSTHVLFRANNGVTGHEVWDLQLTPTGLPMTFAPVANIKPDSTVPESSYASPFVPFGSGFLFGAQNDSTGIELWNTNGTATTLLADVNPAPPVHKLHGTLDATAARYEVTDAPPFGPVILGLSTSLLPNPLALGFLGWSGVLVISPPLVVPPLSITDASGNATISLPFPAVPLASVGVLGAQALVLSGASGAISDVAVETKGSCSLAGFMASASGETNDDTNEYRITLCRTDSNPGTAYFGLVYTTPTGEMLLLEGGEGSLSLEAMECTELSGFFDFYTAEDPTDATGTKILELWMLSVPPTPQNVTSGCRVWQSYC